MSNNKKNTSEWRQATKLVRGGLDRSHNGETSEALFLNSGFTYDSAETVAARFSGDDDGYVYSRYGNPTVSVFEERLALLEGSESCYALASGMAAVFGALSCHLKAGDHIVAAEALFGSCYQVVTTILPRFGITFELVDGTDLDAWKKAITQQTNAVFFESPSNPTLSAVDIEAVSELAHKQDAKVFIDNVFATPVLQKPLQLGADVTIYSATKHIDGQGRILGGAICSDKAFYEDNLKPVLRHTGPTLSSFNAWVLLKGLETLDLRVRAQSHSAAKLAEKLGNISGVKRVIYPHHESHPQYELCKKQMALGGTLVSFEIEGGRERVFKTLNGLGIIDISNNLGDTKSLICHPASTTHHSIGEEVRNTMGVSEGLMRISVGLEDNDDLIEDLSQAIKASA